TPPGFAAVLGWRGTLYEKWRDLAQALSRFDPWVAATMHNADRILVANQPTFDLIPPAYRAKAMPLPSIGCDAFALPPPAPPADHVPCRLLWLGRCEPRKGLPLLLQALAGLPQKRLFHLTVLGTGPEEKRWRLLALRLGLAETVAFAGQVPRQEALARLAASDIFVFTSLRDSSGTAILEAMAAGLPVVCLRWAGPAEIADEACAIFIEPRSARQVAADLGQALLALAKDPARRQAMGRAAQRRCQEVFAWPNKIQTAERIYAEILARRGAP
ncbi:MAG: glycosyltransferase, partial [Planctomycetota bacterium]|nr:glycosyltransferase [Planctomycetota bacterium]